MDTAYYLAANGVPATKPYVLLREALKRSQKVAVAKFALRGRERLGMLRVVDDVIAMHGLLWPDEIRSTEEVAPDASVTVRDKELDLADALMDTLGEVELTELHDDYREAVEELVAAKASGELPAAPPAGERVGGKVLDLMAALEKSVRAAKVSRGEEAGEETGEEAGARTGESAEVTPLPSRRSARTAPKEVGGKKSTSTARKTAAKKTVAKSTAKSTGQAAEQGDGDQVHREEDGGQEDDRQEGDGEEDGREEGHPAGTRLGLTAPGPPRAPEPRHLVRLTSYDSTSYDSPRTPQGQHRIVAAEPERVAQGEVAERGQAAWGAWSPRPGRSRRPGRRSRWWAG